MAAGKEGEDEISLYHVQTKSLMILFSNSFKATDICGDCGYNGGWGCVEF